MNLESALHDIGVGARAAAHRLAQLDTPAKNAILQSMAAEMEARMESILQANQIDIETAEDNHLAPAMIDRLRLTEARVRDMIADIANVATLPDPVGESIREWTLPNELQLTKRRVPIGVIGIIYESRPNVTSDAAVLCVKTGNAVILRGGSEAVHSNMAIAEALQAGGEKAGLPAYGVSLVPGTDRTAVKVMCGMDKFIDLIIPRGGFNLIETVVQHARMPVIKHYHGNCQIYIDAQADLAMAEAIVLNAKCQRPGVCNAVETVLLHRDIAQAFLEKTELLKMGVEIRGDQTVLDILGDKALPATEEDWAEEYLSLILAVRVVDDVQAAVDHIETYGSRHSDAIVTEDPKAAQFFLNSVDSATVYWNASTRFTDGGAFGFGAEIGISTDKLHARGPMALEELTTYKYVIRGNGQIRV